ncbi:MAG: TadE/TadG family type IV pilus assembly protein [Pirellulaceae bacterium]|nr:TadE/TadG family type IV pilus assembly protein [Pirellulaceae bacterium]
MPRTRTLRNCQRKRRGAAAVEFAICLPLLLTLVLGVIETSNALFVQHAITCAAYEGANVASATGGTSATANTRAQQVLTSLGIKSATVSFSPAVTSSTPVGTKIVVTCTVPLTANLASFGYLSGPSLTAVVTTAKL